MRGTIRRRVRRRSGWPRSRRLQTSRPERAGRRRRRDRGCSARARGRLSARGGPRRAESRCTRGASPSAARARRTRLRSSEPKRLRNSRLVARARPRAASERPSRGARRAHPLRTICVSPRSRSLPARGFMSAVQWQILEQHALLHLLDIPTSGIFEK